MYLAGNISRKSTQFGALPAAIARTGISAPKTVAAGACVPTENYTPQFYPSIPLATNVQGLVGQEWQTARMAGLPLIGNLPYAGLPSADDYLRTALLNSDWQKVFNWYAYQISSIQATGRRAATYFYGLATLDLGQHKYTVDSCGHKTYYPFSIQDVCGFVTYVKVKCGVWDKGGGPALFGIPDPASALIPPLGPMVAPKTTSATAYKAQLNGLGIVTATSYSDWSRVNNLNGFLKYCTSKTTGDDWRHEFGMILNNLNGPGKSTPYPGLAVGWIAPDKSHWLGTVLAIIAIAVVVWFTAGALMAAYGPAAGAAGAGGAIGTGAGATVAAGVAAADGLAPIVLTSTLATVASGVGLETVVITGAAAAAGAGAGTAVALTAAGVGTVAVATALTAPSPMTVQGTPPASAAPDAAPLEEVIVHGAAPAATGLTTTEVLTSAPFLATAYAVPDSAAQTSAQKAKSALDKTNSVLKTTNSLLTTAGTIEKALTGPPKPLDPNAGNAALVAPAISAGSTMALIVVGAVLLVMMSGHKGRK